MKHNPEISEYDRFKYDMLASVPMNSSIREVQLQRKDYCSQYAIFYTTNRIDTPIW